MRGSLPGSLQAARHQNQPVRDRALGVRDNTLRPDYAGALPLGLGLQAADEKRPNVNSAPAQPGGVGTWIRIDACRAAISSSKPIILLPGGGSTGISPRPVQATINKQLCYKCAVVL